LLYFYVFTLYSLNVEKLNLGVNASIINVRLSLENTLLTLLRLQSLAYGFETFAWRQKAKLLVS
jgi:hypothetical protein